MYLHSLYEEGDDALDLQHHFRVADIVQGFGRQ